MEEQAIWIAYAVSNIVSILFLWAALKFHSNTTSESRIMKKWLIWFWIIGFPAMLQAQPEAQPPAISAGASAILYQSGFATQSGLGAELALQGPLFQQTDWQLGLRMGLDPVLPEAFGRILLGQQIGRWRPAIGLEIGITGRARFEDGNSLLLETRRAMVKDIGPVYLAVHAAPLSFCLNSRWRISALEVDFGSHLDHLGRTLRLQLGLLSLARSL